MALMLQNLLLLTLWLLLLLEVVVLDVLGRRGGVSHGLTLEVGGRCWLLPLTNAVPQYCRANCCYTPITTLIFSTTYLLYFQYLISNHS